MNNAISIVMITKNADKVLHQCLTSLTQFDDVVLYDNGSTDKTLSIAATFSNVNVVQGEFMGFGTTKAHAARFARHDWVFSLDADEPMSASLVDELLQMQLDDKVCYQVRRDNYYRGKHMKCCGWYPEYIVRLYHRRKTNFSDAKVHETVQTTGFRLQKLKHPIQHYSFFSVADFLTKIQNYSEIYANDMQGVKRVSVLMGVLRGIFAFMKSYFLRRGWLYGFEGFVIAFFHALGTTVKYLKLYEKNNPSK